MTFIIINNWLNEEFKGPNQIHQVPTSYQGAIFQQNIKGLRKIISNYRMLRRFHHIFAVETKLNEHETYDLTYTFHWQECFEGVKEINSDSPDGNSPSDSDRMVTKWVSRKSRRIGRQFSFFQLPPNTWPTYFMRQVHRFQKFTIMKTRFIRKYWSQGQAYMVLTWCHQAGAFKLTPNLRYFMSEKRVRIYTTDVTISPWCNLK